MAEQPVVLGVERGRGGVDVERQLDGDRQLVPLPDVAQVERGAQLDGLAAHALAREGLAPGDGHLVEQRAQPAPGRRRRAEPCTARTSSCLKSDISMPAAQKIDDSARHEQRADVELARDRRGVERPGAAGDHEREVARIEAAAHADVRARRSPSSR